MLVLIDTEHNIYINSEKILRADLFQNEDSEEWFWAFETDQLQKKVKINVDKVKEQEWAKDLDIPPEHDDVYISDYTELFSDYFPNKKKAIEWFELNFGTSKSGVMQ